MATIVIVLLLGASIYLGVDRSRAMERSAALQSDLSDARTQIEELNGKLEAERTARQETEKQVKETQGALETAKADAAQLRQQLQARQEELSGKIQELEANVQEYERRVAAAEQAKSTAESELSKQAALRQQAENKIAELTAQLQSQRSAPGPAEGGGAVAAKESMQETESSSAADAQTGPAGAAPQASGESEGRDYDTPPKPIDLVQPVYPSSLRRERVEGTVDVAFTVDRRGRVGDVEIREATNPAFEAPAREAVRQWRFEPALRDGKPVEVRVVQRLRFSLQ